jgi:dTDP-4-amino-4,6-dideoxygalactose transaminase
MGALLSSKMPCRRPEIMNELKRLGVGTSIYYPHPVPEMSYYRKACKGEFFPNARLISESMIALPVGPHLDQTDMTRISETLKSVLEKHS